jgi:AcrR family transcriptional regulator
VYAPAVWVPSGDATSWPPPVLEKPGVTRNSAKPMLDHPAESRSQFVRIPAGQHGLSSELVSADQRARLDAATVQAVAESGYIQTTVEDVISRAGVSRRTFYELYDNKQECFIAACDEVLRDWRHRGTLAYHTETTNDAREAVRVRLRAGLLALFRLVLDDPLGARVVFIETLNCGSVGLRRLDQAVDELQRNVQRAFQPSAGSPPLPPAMVKVIVGGVLEIVTVRLRHDRTDELLELTDPLVEWMLSYRCPKATAAVSRMRLELTTSPRATDETAGKRTDGMADAEQVRVPLWRDESMRPIAVQKPRARILAAAAQIASEHGYSALSANAIARTARVSHHTFRSHFRGKDEAFTAAYYAGSQDTLEYALKAYSAAPDWPSAVHAGLAAELCFLSKRPALARIGFLEVYAAGPEALKLRETELQQFTAALEPGYRQRPGAFRPHPVVSEAIAGGIYQLMRECVLHHPPERLTSLSPEATYAALAPFIGAKAAVSVAIRPPIG